MEDLYFDVLGIGCVRLVQECGANLMVEDESGTRMLLPASRCVRKVPGWKPETSAADLAEMFPGAASIVGFIDRADRASAIAAAALADQFTGDDLGALMAEAEFDHSAKVSDVGCVVSTPAGRGVVQWLVATPGGWVYAVQAVHCPEFRIQVLMGDEFTIED